MRSICAGVTHHPEGVAHAGIGDDVDFRRGRCHLGRQFINRGILLVGEEHRPGLGIERVHLAHAVVFLVGAGELVLADAVGVVIGHAGGGDEAGLLMIAHDQPVEVVAGGAVLLQHPFREHALEVFLALGVDLRVMGIGFGGQVDLGLGDVEEAPGLAFGAFAGLAAVEDVIGGRGHFGGFFGKGTQARERANERHGAGSWLRGLKAAY